ncbi:MAG: NAD+ synthase [Candidatus Nanohaloarchaea archaeon]|nr:NAD+ synthase [Candidatus Nanohaloarchaea archaeon]
MTWMDPLRERLSWFCTVTAMVAFDADEFCAGSLSGGLVHPATTMASAVEAARITARSMPGDAVSHVKGLVGEEMSDETRLSVEQGRDGMMAIADARQEIERFLADYVEQADADGYVLGVSGGLDSAVTLQLAVNAVGAGAVTGLVMPGKPSREEHMEDARSLCSDLDVVVHEMDIEPVVDEFCSIAPFDPGPVATGNVRVRTRMVFTYLAANHGDRLVLGSSNRTEALLGYFTKYGDGAADVRPIADLYKTEVRELAQELDLPPKFVEKPPSAGMWNDQTDREELGASYDVIDRVLMRLVDDGMSVAETVAETGIAEETVQRFAEMHRDRAHKRTPIPTPGIR